jgi:uncharacterized protein YgiM (DUF1202 family)
MQFWIARYPSKAPMNFNDIPNATKKPDVGGLIAWQYSSAGRIPSAYNGDLDLNMLYSPIMEQLRKTGKCTANSLRIRSNPSTADKNNIVGYLKKDDNVIIYATDVATGWYQIDLDGKKWVSNQYIKLN